jgi:peptidyl-prolyl cis-trans isomerase C
MTFERSFPAAIFAVALLLQIGAARAQEQSPPASDQTQQPTAEQAQPATPAVEPPPDTVVAIVNGKKITRADVIESAKQLPAEYQQQLDQIFPALIDRQVDLTLLSEEAGRQKLEEDPEIKRQVAEYTASLVREAVLERHLKTAITDAAIKTRYDQFVAALPKQQEVKARHILVEQEQEAKDIVAQLDGGADFSAIAKEKSKDPGSGSQGGDVGYFVAGQMVPEFSAAAFALEKGQYTKTPVKSQFGWHVIIADDKRDKAPPSLEEARGTIEQILSNELVTALVDGLRKSATVQKFNPDGTPRAPETGGKAEEE